MAHYARNNAIYAKARQRALTQVVADHRAEYRDLYQRYVTDLLGPSKQGRVISQGEARARKRAQNQAQRHARRELWLKYQWEWAQAYHAEIDKLRG